MWGRRVSERGKEEASAGWVGFCWAAAGRARGEGRWATAGCWLDRLGPFVLFLFFTDSFLFLITEINITFEIQFQIGSNQNQKFGKIKIISLNTLEPFPKYFIFI